MAAAVRVSGRATPGWDYTVEILQHMLCVATRHGGVPLKLRMKHARLLEDAHATHGRLILLTAHFGLTLAIQRALYERRIPLCCIGDVTNRTDGWHWGCPVPANIIASGPYCLLRAARSLEHGFTVLAYPDEGLFAPEKTRRPTMLIHHNLFDFAAITGATVLFFGAKLTADNAILIDIVRPAHWRPAAPGDAQALAREFLAFAAARTVRPCEIEEAPEVPALPERQHAAARDVRRA